MRSISELHDELLSLTVYRDLLSAPVTSRLAALTGAVGGGSAGVCDAWGELCAFLAQSGSCGSLYGAVLEEILTCDCITAQLFASGKKPDIQLTALTVRDLDILYRAAGTELSSLAIRNPVHLGTLPAAPPFDRPWDQCLDGFAAFHRANGVGQFVRNKAFIWESGKLRPVRHPDPIRLCDLKEYEYQRGIAINNTRAFLQGFKANNILLYGDRGTGKSSTVKALLNEYSDLGLRMIEMPKEDLRRLSALTEQLAANPMRFIIFIDDLSFSGDEDNYAALKAVLEGGLASTPDNVLIYATSNRRHLLRESFSSRSGDEVHQADTVQEAVSLSDRFGICINFLMPDKQRFLNIVRQTAADEGIDMPEDELLAAAEKWALERGGRSPRFIRQFLSGLAGSEYIAGL